MTEADGSPREREDVSGGDGTGDNHPGHASPDEEQPPEDGTDFADDPEVGDNIFGPAEERGPIEPGHPDAENVLFVLIGILVGVLVVMRLVGAI